MTDKPVPSLQMEDSIGRTPITRVVKFTSKGGRELWFDRTLDEEIEIAVYDEHGDSQYFFLTSAQWQAVKEWMA